MNIYRNSFLSYVVQLYFKIVGKMANDNFLKTYTFIKREREAKERLKNNKASLRVLFNNIKEAFSLKKSTPNFSNV